LPDPAFKRGEHWRVGETVTALIAMALIAPLVIVGIHNTGLCAGSMNTRRPPTNARRRPGGCTAAARRRVEAVVDDCYRTPQDPAHRWRIVTRRTASLYLGLTRPDVFSRLAVLSPSVWWDRRAICVTFAPRIQPRLRMWVTSTAEGQHVTNLRLLRQGSPSQDGLTVTISYAGG
jgi:enterochelin esterase-like enzyme